MINPLKYIYKYNKYIYMTDIKVQIYFMYYVLHITGSFFWGGVGGGGTL